jgi:predicted RNA-binding protein associated with RNAse of E/G family
VTVVEYRHVHAGRTFVRFPARVVQDDDEAVVLWWPVGTVYEKARMGDRAGHLDLLVRGAWELERVEWWGCDALHVIPVGKPYALWPYRENGQLRLWYGNLQAPLVRTDVGFETTDWTLDLIAGPDPRTGWTWKDEDELAEGQRIGLYSAADIARIRAAGDEVAALFDSGAALFDRWASWRRTRRGSRRPCSDTIHVERTFAVRLGARGEPHRGQGRAGAQPQGRLPRAAP